MADVTLNINATINNNTISDSKLSQVPECTIKGRECGTGTGDVENLNSDQVSTMLDTATDPFVRTSNLPAPGSLPDGDYGDIVVSAGGTVMDIDPNVKSDGGNFALDSGKIAVYWTEGQLHGSAAGSSHAALYGQATSSSYAVYGESQDGTAIVASVSGSGNGADISANTGYGAIVLNLSTTNPVLRVRNLNALSTQDIGQFLNQGSLGLLIKNSGALQWTSATGASVTRTNLGLGTAALNNTGDFDSAGSAASAQAFAIQRANHTGTQDASTVTGTKTSSFISDFAATVRSTVLTGISFATYTAVLATDTILEALGKLQAFNNLFTTVGLAIARLANPSAVRFLRINADNTVTARSDSEMRTDLGLGTAAVVNTGSGSGDVPTISTADSRYTLKSENTEYIQCFRTNTTITNIPAAATGLVSDLEIPLRALRADLTGRTQTRLECVVGTAGNSGSKFAVRYKTGAFSSNKADYSPLGASSTEVFCSLATGGDVVSDSGWINITAGALAEVWIIPITLDGDGAADPVLKQGLISYK